MWDTCTHHFEPERFDRVDSGCPILPLIAPYFDLPWPPPANPVNFFWPESACTCVPHVVLHVSGWIRTSGGHFRPSEVRFRATFAIFGDYFIRQKGPFPSTDLAENLWTPKHLPDLNPRAGKWAISDPKKSFRHGVWGAIACSTRIRKPKLFL